VTIRILQDKAVRILVEKRISIYNKFIKKISQSRETISVETAADMKHTIRKMAVEKKQMLSRIDTLEKELDEMKTEYSSLKQRERKMRKLIELLTIKNNEKRSQPNKETKKSVIERDTSQRNRKTKTSDRITELTNEVDESIFNTVDDNNSVNNITSNITNNIDNVKNTDNIDNQKDAGSDISNSIIKETGDDKGSTAISELINNDWDNIFG
jgi:hypothetical protein